MTDTLNVAVTALQQGQLIAYPTEAVYGLGCDPWNQQAVLQLCQLKQRSVEQGVIIVASDWQQIESLIQPLDPMIEAEVRNSWPGHTTWLLPCTDAIPSWVRGKHTSIAIRISAHPTVQQLCQQFGKPIISTSANRHGEPALTQASAVANTFGDSIAVIIDAPLGGAEKPSTIRDALSGKIIRD